MSNQAMREKNKIHFFMLEIFCGTLFVYSFASFFHSLTNTVMMLSSSLFWLVPSLRCSLIQLKLGEIEWISISVRQISFKNLEIKIVLTFLNPMSLEYSLKHCLHNINPYLRMIPWLLEQARLKSQKKKVSWFNMERIQVRNSFREFSQWKCH